jgi:hypothetical protein
VFEFVIQGTCPNPETTLGEAGFYLAASYVTSRRGPEGRLLDLEGMWTQKGVHLDSTVLALRGKVKGETASRAHVFPCVHITSSGINLKDWMHMCLLAYLEEGRFDGPAVSNAAGFVLTSSEIDDMFHNALIRVLAVLPNLFPQDIQTPEDIKAKIQSCRSLRRSLILPRSMWTRSTDGPSKKERVLRRRI